MASGSEILAQSDDEQVPAETLVDSLALASFDTATVRRGDLTAEKEFNASISFGDEWTVTSDATGLITAQRDIGETVGFGGELIRVNNAPLTLAEGSMPMYRTLQKVDTRGRDEFGNRLKLMTGPDVEQLQRFLLDSGFDAEGKLVVDGEFGPSTERAVKAWQQDVGHPISGLVNSSQLVFSADPVRIASASRIGSRFESLTVSREAADILVDTSNRDRSALIVGGSVKIELADGTAVEGTVTKQEQVTVADGSRVWRTTIGAPRSLPTDTSTVTVGVVETVASDVFIVPVGSLLALGEGGFGVEVVDDAGQTAIVAVTVGEVLDGQAEIDGPIEVGAKVVVAQ